MSNNNQDNREEGSYTTELAIFLCLSAFPTATVGCSNGGSRPSLADPCDRDKECGDLICDVDTPMAGQCTEWCNSTPSCQERFGPNSMCIGAYRCVRTCERQEDCPKGTFCNEFGWCRRSECASDDHCWRFVCDPATGTCRTSCLTDADCQPGYFCDTTAGAYECFD